jgi:hypothetical protein
MKRAFLLIPLVLIVVVIAGCSLHTKTSGNSNDAEAPKSPLLQPVSNNQIEKIRAAKMDFEKPGDSTIKNIELTLSESQTKELLDWYNAIPGNRIFAIDEIEGSIKLGVVLELHENVEIRIQYTSSGVIFVTVSQNGTKKYRIEMLEIKPLFDQLLR